MLFVTVITCRLRNLYAGQEATVGTGHGTTDWFQIGKGNQGADVSFLKAEQNFLEPFCSREWGKRRNEGLNFKEM